MADEYHDYFRSRTQRDHLVRHRVVVSTARTVCGEWVAGAAAPLRTISKITVVKSDCPVCYGDGSANARTV